MKHYIIYTAIACFLLSSCERDFIEDDLRGKLVSVIAPASNDTVSSSVPLFWWNELSGALTYRVQIVYPDFTAPQALLYDTAVSGDRFYPSLSAGVTYYWRIRPENGSSEGDWVTRALTIDSSASLSSQQVVITLPAVSGTATSSSSVSFVWNAVSGATLYRLEIVNSTSGSTVASSTTSVTGYTAVLAQGSYEFKVRAENSSSFTAWSTVTITVDQTAPSAPSLLLPANNAFYSSAPATVSFDWTSSTDALTDSLFLSTDSTFATGIQLSIALAASQSSYTWNGALSGNIYFWKVRSTDAAGNRSNYSTTFRFDVN